MDDYELRERIDYQIGRWMERTDRELSNGARQSLYHIFASITLDPSPYWDESNASDVNRLQEIAIEELPMMLTMVFVGSFGYPSRLWRPRWRQLRSLLRRRDIRDPEWRDEREYLVREFENELLASIPSRIERISHRKGISSWEILHSISDILDDWWPIPKDPMR